MTTKQSQRNFPTRYRGVVLKRKPRDGSRYGSAIQAHKTATKATFLDARGAARSYLFRRFGRRIALAMLARGDYKIEVRVLIGDVEKNSISYGNLFEKKYDTLEDVYNAATGRTDHADN